LDKEEQYKCQKNSFFPAESEYAAPAILLETEHKKRPIKRSALKLVEDIGQAIFPAL
jgi:hypothetical protein